MPDTLTQVSVHPSHNAALSLWQSALHNVLLKTADGSSHKGIGITASNPNMIAAAQVMQHFDNTGNFSVAATSSANGSALSPRATPVELECAKLAAQIAFYSATDPSRAEELKTQLVASACDPLWAEVLAEYDRYRLSGQQQKYINYNDIDDFVIENCFPDVATIAIIGDWGTGMNDALVLLQQIAQNFKPDVLIHLGDIYYSGLPSECQSHFTKFIAEVWPDGGTNPVPLVFTMDGNHDRYAGTLGGYYDLIANLNKGAGRPQPNSYFAIRNNFWQFVAMDTGYYDADPCNVNSNVTKLVDQEVTWHLDKVKNNGANVDTSVNASGVRGTILLSHHQLFSFTGVGKNAAGQPLAVNSNLVNALSGVFNLVDAWLWGHEHNLCIFEPYSSGPGQPLPRGRCVGASAVPVFLSQAFKAPPNLVVPEGETGPPKIIDGTALSNNGTVFNYSYAILQLNRETLSIEYYQLNSSDALPGSPPKLTSPLYTETIEKPLAAE